MRRSRFTPALPALVAALAMSPAARAQQEPSLFEEPAPSPTPTPAAPAPLPLSKPTTPQAPLRPALDFARWQEMNPRERQTFVEGAVLVLGLITSRLRGDLSLDARVPPETLSAVVRVVDTYHPTRAPLVYLKEMDSIYLTAEGQKLAMLECFQQAFRRVNGR